MLILSRRLHEKVVFPGVGATVQVVAVQRGVVRLGIEAPPDVAVFRAELLDRDGAVAAAPADRRQPRHELRNRLNAAAIGLALLRQQLRRGGQDVEATLATVDQEIQKIRETCEAALAPAAPPAPPPARACRALLVEDDRNERELLAGFLRLAGLEVDTAGDGADALGYLRDRGRPDVLLLDMALPRCDGPTTIRAIRQDPAQAGLKIFGMTGHALDGFQRATEGADVARWFAKPIDPEALLRELRRELGGLA
jgi:carbon storage regulator CsrA